LSKRLVVRTDDLARILEEFIEKHDARHPKDTARIPLNAMKGLTVMVGGFTGKQYISLHSGKGVRSLDRILSRETQYTTLEKADELLVAIEDPGALVDGRLEILEVRGGLHDAYAFVGTWVGFESPGATA
jgi:hypothetical protein